MLLNDKFGVAFGICNPISLGWGTREQERKKKNEKYTQNGVSKKKKKKEE
jgi:hypothetical protein